MTDELPPLSPAARAALDALRGAHDPTPDVAPRLRASLDGRVRLRARRALAAKVGGALLAVVAAAWWARTPPPAPTPPTFVATSVTPSAAAPSMPVAPSQTAVVAEPATVAPAAAVDAGVAMVRNTNDPATAARVPARPRCLPDDELRSIRAADASLRAGDARASLRAAQELARRCPDGALAEEREALRVMSLCALRDPSRDRAAARFRAQWPRSPARDRVAALCGATP